MKIIALVIQRIEYLAATNFLIEYAAAFCYYDSDYDAKKPKMTRLERKQF